MRLTDEIIGINAKKYSDNFLASFDDAFEAGAKFASDFYENKKCETCKYSGKCKIEEIGKLVMDPFSCKKWEPENEQVTKD